MKAICRVCRIVYDHHEYDLLNEFRVCSEECLEQTDDLEQYNEWRRIDELVHDLLYEYYDDLRKREEEEKAKQSI